jgi:hypothetical protein
LLGTKIAVTLQHKYSENATITAIWSHSKIALAWLRRLPHTCKSFVANRVSATQNMWSSGSWKYVPTEDNPADLASRGCSGNNAEALQKWVTCLELLLEQETPWKDSFDEPGDLRELRLLTVTQVSTSVINEDWIVQHFIKKYSTFTKMRNVLAILLRFKYSANHSQVRAANLLYQADQSKWWKTAKDDQRINVQSHANNVLRVVTRARNSSESWALPIWLHKQSILLRRIIQQTQERSRHSSRDTTLNLVRSHYWSPRLWQSVRSESC